MMRSKENEKENVFWMQLEFRIREDHHPVSSSLMWYRKPCEGKMAHRGLSYVVWSGLVHNVQSEI
jgi:hypothetical protein